MGGSEGGKTRGRGGEGKEKGGPHTGTIPVWCGGGSLQCGPFPQCRTCRYSHTAQAMQRYMPRARISAASVACADMRPASAPCDSPISLLHVSLHWDSPLGWMSVMAATPYPKSRTLSQWPSIPQALLCPHLGDEYERADGTVRTKV